MLLLHRDFCCGTFTMCLQMGGAEMTLHHLGSLMAVATALFTGDGHMPTTWMLVTEFTTPLINNRWWLDKLVSSPIQSSPIGSVRVTKDVQESSQQL